MKLRLTMLLGIAVIALTAFACGGAEEPVEPAVPTTAPTVEAPAADPPTPTPEPVAADTPTPEVAMEATEIPDAMDAMEEGKFGGELRIVSQASIATLDPNFTGAYVTIAVAAHIFDSPFGWDDNLTDQPEMVESFEVSDDMLTWTFTLKDGMNFHDGTQVSAQDVVPSFTRWLESWDAAATFMREFVADTAVTAVDDRTFSIHLTEPYGGVTVGLAKPWAAVFVMPARISQKSAAEGLTQEEYIGAGPYKFSSWDQGDKIELVRFEDYAKDSRPTSLYTGLQHAYLDKLTWLEIPDEETKIAGLETGEWDVVDGAGLDFYSRLVENPDIIVPLYKPGHRTQMDLIPSHSPFDNTVLRRAVQVGVNIEDLMASLGPSDLWQLCPAIFFCNAQYETDFGSEGYYNVNDQDLARELMQEAGYAGETITWLNPTDYGTITPVGIVFKAQMQELGFTIEMPANDWSTVIAKLGSTEDYHGFSNWAIHWCCGDPIVDVVSTGGAGYWPKIPKITRLRREFAQATDFPTKFSIVERIQEEAYKSVITIYGGNFFSIFPHRADVNGFSVKGLAWYTNAWLDR